MRCAVLLVAVVVAPALVHGQTIPPWPVAPTPHAASNRTQPEADFTLQGPGRVPVDLRSSAVQHVLAFQRAAVRPHAPDTHHEYLGIGACTTPCTLYVPPGTVTLRTVGPGLRETEDDLRIPLTGADVFVRAPSRPLFNVGAGLVGVGATVFVAEFVGVLASQSRGDTVSTPGVLGVAIAAGVLLIAGISLVVSERTGFDVAPR